VSHGCVRVSMSQGRWLVDNIPLGTLVTVRAR
jgi:lipoprotein-anchoring transpeptidase ErfK/SrfK